MRARLRELLLGKGGFSFAEIVGVAASADLRKHIESQFEPGMNWENYGRFGWQVDHILPLRDVATDEEIRKAFHFTNLRPKWWYENRIGNFVPNSSQ